MKILGSIHAKLNFLMQINQDPSWSTKSLTESWHTSRSSNENFTCQRKTKATQHSIQIWTKLRHLSFILERTCMVRLCLMFAWSLPSILLISNYSTPADDFETETPRRKTVNNLLFPDGRRRGIVQTMDNATKIYGHQHTTAGFFHRQREDVRGKIEQEEQMPP